MSALRAGRVPLAAWLPASLALALVAWCRAVEPEIADGAPARLADTGLYADFATRTPAADVMPYAPQYPLWTDGASKRRWIRLPAGSAIDASEPDAWRFPVGTRLWKEFAFERAVETRMLERCVDGWRFATYVWSADGTDAVLAPERGLRGACESGFGTPHDVPARADCGACHLAGPSAVLGFSALQLSDERDPLAVHAEAPPPGSVALRELVRRGLVRGLPPEHVARAPRIAARTPRERAALGTLHANCGGCHAEGGALASLGLVLDQRLGARPERVLDTLIGVAGRASGACDGAPRIAPGDPAGSLLLARMGSRSAALQMPPLGTHVADDEALALLRAWIQDELGPSEPAPIPTFLPSDPHSFPPLARTESRR